PRLCYQFQNFLKTRTKHILCQQWKQRQRLYGVKVQENFPFIPLVLDTDTVKNEPCNKILLKSKKSKKPRSKKMKAYIPRDTHQKSHEDLFNSREQNILIVGKPGIGKTTVIQQMLHHWAERQDRKLDFMFYFDENTLSNTSNVVNFENLLLGTFLMSNPELKDNADEIVQYLQEYSEKVTVVFDGIRDFQDNAILQRIMQHELLPEAKLVVTCRPEVEYEFSDWSTYTVYVQGFNEESIYDFFTAMSNNDPELVDSVINNPALFSLCHVPMYAFMVAACISYYTSDEAQKPCTATELYVRIFRHCLQRHGKVSLLQLDGHIKNCRDVILSLAECAFNATKLKTIKLEFEFEARGIAGIFLKTVVSPAHQRLFCAFHHNTMQEFFSALWLLEKAELLDEVLQLCQNEESKHMKHVIPFLCGLQSRTNTDHLKCLLPLNEFKENADNFLKKVFNTFLDNQQGDEYVDIAFICQCLYEYQSAGPCCSFLEEINYHLDLSEEHLDPYTCSAVSYVISQSGNKQVHLSLENSAVSLTGLKTILKHSKYLRYFSTTLCQVWTVALQCEELNYLRNLLLLCGNEMHISMSSQTDVLEQAGKIITQNTEQIILHLHCDKDPQQLTELFFNTVLSWLPYISSL
ncbi:protein NLRC5-like, partial [Clarias magur]